MPSIPTGRGSLLSSPLLSPLLASPNRPKKGAAVVVVVGGSLARRGLYPWGLRVV